MHAVSATAVGRAFQQTEGSAVNSSQQVQLQQEHGQSSSEEYVEPTQDTPQEEDNLQKQPPHWVAAPLPEDGDEAVRTNSSLLREPIKVRRTPGYGLCCYFFMCFTISLGCSALAIGLWSNMGIGEDTMKFLEDEGWLAYVFGGTLVGVLSLLYLVDFFWPPHLPGKYLVLWPQDPCVGKLMLLLCVLCFIFACLFCAEDYPGIPLIMTIFLSPTLVLLLRVKTNPRTGFEELASPEELQAMDIQDRLLILSELTGSERDSNHFYKAAMISYLLCALISLGVWGPWAFHEKDELLDEMKALRNATNVTSAAEKEKLYIMWCAPLGVAFSNLMFFILVMVRVVMSKSYEGTNELKNKLIVEADTVGKAKNHLQQHVLLKARLSKVFKDSDQAPLTEEKKRQYMEMHTSHMRQISRMIKIMGSSILLMLGTFYVAAELVAADSHLAMMFQGFLGCFFLTFFAFIFVSFRRLLNAMSSWLHEMPLYRMALAISDNDWIKALGVACSMPLLPFIVAISAANQCIRKCRGIAGRVVGAPPVSKEPGSQDSKELGNPSVEYQATGALECQVYRKPAQPQGGVVQPSVEPQSQHLGMLYGSNALVEVGMWGLRRWKKAHCLTELSLMDAKQPSTTFLYRLSKQVAVGLASLTADPCQYTLADFDSHLAASPWMFQKCAPRVVRGGPLRTAPLGAHAAL